MKLGDKLRKARQEAGLSQRELCGETITRNMLSQIEHGTASPSIGTLQYLAGRLGKPVGYFFEEAAWTSANFRCMEQAGRALEAEKYPEAARALEAYQGPDPVYDGAYGLMRQAVFLTLADRAIVEERPVYARELLQKAEPLTLPAFRQEKQRLTEALGEVRPGALDARLLLRAASEENPERAERLLLAADNQNSPEWQLQMGRVLMAQGKYARARDCLLQAEEACPRQTAPLLEQCFRELEDFRQAYFYACRQK